MADKSHGVLLSCRRARGFESKRTNEPPTECRGCEVRPRLTLALRGLSWFMSTSHTQHATCHGSPTAPSPTTRGASEPRFRLRRFGPLSQPSGPKPGMGQVPSPEPLVWWFSPPGRRKLPISELQPTDRNHNRVPRSVAPLGAGWPLVSRVPLLPAAVLYAHAYN